MSVDCGASSFNRNTVLLNLRLKTFLQKREAALLAKSYDGNGKPRTSVASVSFYLYLLQATDSLTESLTTVPQKCEAQEL